MAVPIRDDAVVRRIPWVTYALIVVNILVFLFLEPPGAQGGTHDGQLRSEVTGQEEVFFDHWGAIPCELTHGKPLGTAQCDGDRSNDPDNGNKNVWLSMLTSMFLHGSLGHLAGNMLFLWVFGAVVEDRLGSPGYLAFYLVSGFIAVWGFAVFNWSSQEPMVGASGAIAGVLGAYLVYRPRGRVLIGLLSTAVQVLYVPAWVLLGLFFTVQFFTPEGTAIAWMAHVAGMVGGALLALATRPFLPEARARRAGPQQSDDPSNWVLPTAPPPG